MGEVWIKEAEDLAPVGSHNAMSGVGGPRATLHCTVSPSGGSWFDAMHKVLIGKKAESHLLYDPVTDRLGQYFPLDRAARALAGSAGALPYSHNRAGSVNIQIEVVANPRDWTWDWKPGPNFRAMMRAVRSWGIRDEFVYRVATSGTDRANVVRPNRLLTSSEGGGKWWGHCHYGDGESHWDPGPISLPRFFAAAPLPAPAPPATPTPAPAPILGGHSMLVQVTGQPEVWVTNGFTRRHIPNPTALADYRAALKTSGAPAAASVIHEVPTEARALAAFGPIVK